MSYKNIRFFDKNGHNINPTLNNDNIFEFSVALEKTATNLFATQHIFMLEEVLYEIEGTYSAKAKQIFVPTLITVLRYLRDWGDAVPKNNLNQFFNYNSVDEYYINNFLNNNSKYLHKIFYGDIEYYTISSEGRIYLESYETGIALLDASNYRLETAYTHPRTESNTESGEDVYLTFNWSSYDNDDNIFLFFIDPEDTTVYKGESAFSTDKKLPRSIKLKYNYNFNWQDYKMNKNSNCFKILLVEIKK